MNPPLDSSLQMLGGFIRNARTKRKLSQVLAAEKIGVDYRHYQSIEGGKINMRLDTLYKVVHFYDLEFQLSPSGVITCLSL